MTTEMTTASDLVAGPLTLASLAMAINREHVAAVSCAQTAVEHARRAGELLIEAKARCEHGAWLPWLAAHCEVSAREAQRYMKVAADLENTTRVSHLSLRQALGVRTPHVAQNTGEFEWYTPAECIARVRAVLGEIDLDPASCAEANRVVGAKRYYGAEDDGLQQEWAGRVFMNPPYAAGVIGKFIDKLIASPGVTAAVVLVNNGTETRWGQALVAAARCICLPAGRVRFWAPREPEASPLQGQLFAYLGADTKTFAEHFGGIGNCLEVMQTRTTI